MCNASIFLILLLAACGCSRPDGTRLDGLLSTNHIDGFEIVDDEHDKTNILSGEAAARLIRRLSATNRVANPLPGRSYASGTIWLLENGQRVDGIPYFPRERVLSYRRYEFGLRDTNDIHSLFP